MKKLILAAAAAFAIAGSSLAYNAVAAPGGPPDAAHMQRMMDDMATMLDAHIGGMKAALKLTADQDKTWAPFEAAVRSAAKAGQDSMTKMMSTMKPGEQASPIQHMQDMSDHMAQASAQLKTIADAAKPLYDGLDDGQKKHFGPLLMTLMPHHPGHGHGGMMAMMMGHRGGMDEDGPDER